MGLVLATNLLGAAPKTPPQPLVAPYGVAVGPRDVVYVADPGAQRIFEGTSGAFRAIAGSGYAGAGGLVDGGFADGPASSAKFDKPLGIAVDRDGSLLVADSANHCIRKIELGIVSTFAGNPEQAGTADGTLANARFKDPMAISSDGAGTFYVADYGVGIRKLTENAVTTVSIPGAGTAIHAVAAHMQNGATTLFGASDTAFFKYDVEKNVPSFYAGSAAVERSIGMPAGMVALDDVSMLFADPAFRTVRHFWSIAGTASFDGDYSQTLTNPELREDESGFASSSPLTQGGVRLVGPTDVARKSDGSVVVADPAGRQVVELPAPDTRRPVSDNISDLSLDPEKYYRVALVGNSYAYTDVSYAQSVGAVLEDDLNRTRSKSGPSKPVKVLTVRMSASATDEEASYVQSFLPGTVDLVVWMFNDNHVAFEMHDHPKIAAMAATDALRDTLRATMSTLAASDTKLFVAYQPDADESSSVENRFGRDGTTIRYEMDGLGAQIRATLAASGVPYADLQPRIQAEERRAVRKAYFATYDAHPSVDGAAAFGRAIASALVEHPPWTR